MITLFYKDNDMKKIKKRLKRTVDNKLQYERYKKRILSNLRKYEDPILLEVSRDVDFETDKIDDVLALMGRVLSFSKTGVGLAACQIGYNLNIALIQDGDNRLFMINPEIIKESEDKSTLREGCLSYPGLELPISRSEEITVKFFDEKGKEQTNEYRGLTARIIQHEIDHLKGACQLYSVWKDNNNK